MEKEKNALYAYNDEYIEDLVSNPDYQIRENGEIWTLIQRTGKRSVSDNWRKLPISAKKARKSNKRYVSVSYKYKELSVHRIMYRKFVGSLDPNKVINHIDGNSENNSPANLELVTQGENNTHRFRVLGNRAVTGARKLSLEEVALLRRRRAAGATYKTLMSEFGVSKSTVSYICNNKTYNKWMEPDESSAIGRASDCDSSEQKKS